MSQRPPCPPGASWISPYLTVKSCETSIAWYQKAFGFEQKMAMPGPDGKIAHAELVWQGQSFMIGPEGGFTDEELASARLAGFKLVTLGPRTLRTETAALALCAAAAVRGEAEQ